MEIGGKTGVGYREVCLCLERFETDGSRHELKFARFFLLLGRRRRRRLVLGARNASKRVPAWCEF